MSVVRLLLERLDERMLFEGVRVRATSLAFGGDGRTSKCAEATEGSAFGVGGKLDDDGELVATRVVSSGLDATNTGLLTK
jgi:hypothetical protein